MIKSAAFSTFATPLGKRLVCKNHVTIDANLKQAVLFVALGGEPIIGRQALNPGPLYLSMVVLAP